MMPATALVVGGGVYGASIAIYLRQRRHFDRVLLLEREQRLFRRSSYVNQARIHNGYHYPRSFTTAYRSRINLPRFLSEFEDCAVRDFTKLYAVARANSKITSRQFERFCDEIGASLSAAEPEHLALFDPRLVASVYRCEEYGFDTSILAALLARRLAAAGVEVRTGAAVEHVEASADGVVARGFGFAEQGAVLFNCTYAGLQHAAGVAGGNRFGLKHEITEMALIALPPALKGLAVTVMDGPFFSFMPFPDRGLHTLSHVRYTPHLSWREDGERSPYDILDAYPRVSRADRMARDASRYMPALAGVEVHDSLFEVKTVPIYTEGNDGRPILLDRGGPGGRIVSVLGGKIDNVYDILERLDDEPLPGSGELAA